MLGVISVEFVWPLWQWYQKEREYARIPIEYMSKHGMTLNFSDMNPLVRYSPLPIYQNLCSFLVRERNCDSASSMR